MPVKVNIPLKPCEECGQLFRPRPDRAAKIRFCKHECFKKWYARTTQAKRIQRTCIRCGKSFSVIRAQAAQLHCSMDCARYRVTVTCPRCGRVYERHRYQTLKVEKGCGKACTNRTVTKQCLRCGKDYQCKWSHVERSRYCSTSCRSRRTKTYFDPTTTHRVCRICGENKALKGNFSRSRKGIGGYVRTCHKCREPNPDRVKQHRRTYYRKHKPLLIKKSAAWRKANPARVTAIISRNRAKRARAQGSFTAQEWADLCARYDHRCVACRAQTKLCTDHVIPLSRGGSNFIDNIQPLCRSCNSRKNNKIIDYRPTFYATGTDTKSS